MRIFLLGFMASGKSAIGKKLANKIGYTFIDLDHLIERKTGKTVSEIFEFEGEKRFREYETSYLKELLEQDDIVVSVGGGTPTYQNNMELIKESGISFYLKVPPEILLGRLRENKQNRPLVKDLNDEELKLFVITKLKEREPFYKKSDFTIDTTKLVLEQIMTKLDIAS